MGTRDAASTYTHYFILTESINLRTLKKIQEVAMKIDRITPVTLIFALLLSLVPAFVYASGDGTPPAPQDPEKRSSEFTVAK
jgi:hypothetical protein